MFRYRTLVDPRGSGRVSAALILLALAVVPASAQTHRTALSVTGGWSQLGNLTPGFATSTVLEPGWTTGLQLETWLPSGRIGFRTGGSFASRADQAGTEYSVISGDIGMLTRLLPARAGRLVAPYVALGVGGVLYQGAEGSAPIGGGLYGPNPMKRAVAVGGLGLDLLSSNLLGIRLEASDQVVLLSVGESPDSEGLPMAHNIYFTTGVQLRLGRIWPAASVGPRVSSPAGPKTTPAPTAAARQAAPQPAETEAQPRREPRPRPNATEAPETESERAPDARELEVARLQAALKDRDRQISELDTRMDSLERKVVRDDRPSPQPSPQPTRAATRSPSPTPAAASPRAEAATSSRAASGPAAKVASASRSPRRSGPLGRPVPDSPPAPPTRERDRGPRGPVVASTAAAPARTRARGPESPAPRARTSANARVLHTVEVGSDLDDATARQWATRLRQNGLPVWLRTVTIQDQRYRRVRVGLVGSEAEARELARELLRTYGSAMSIARVTRTDSPPAGALAATRGYLRARAR